MARHASATYGDTVRLALRFLIFVQLALALSGCAGGMRENLVSGRERDAGFETGTFALLAGRLGEEGRLGKIPGGQLAIVRRGRLVYTNVFGRELPEAKSRAIGRGTLFDVASLTKPIVGGACAAWIATHTRNEEDIEVARLLLSARSNMDDEAIYTNLASNVAAGDAMGSLDTLVAQLQREDCHRYSNSAYGMLGLMAERAGMNVAALNRDFFEPLGAKGMTFAPLRAATSGRDGSGDWLSGRPYDPLADALTRTGHFPAHSGLFASAEDVAIYTANLVSVPREPMHAILAAEMFGPTARLEDCLTSEILYVSQGGLVSPTTPPWAPDSSRPGRYFRQTGYTGCLLWVDVESQLTVALVTNASATGEFDRWEAFSEDIMGIVLRGRRR